MFEIRLHRTARMFTLSFGVGTAPACVVRRIPRGRATIALARPVRVRVRGGQLLARDGTPGRCLNQIAKRRMRSADGSYARYHHGNLVIFVDFRVGVTHVAATRVSFYPAPRSLRSSPFLTAATAASPALTRLGRSRSAVSVVIFVLSWR